MANNDDIPQIGDLYFIKRRDHEEQWELIVMVIDEERQLVLSDTDTFFPETGHINRWDLAHDSLDREDYIIEKLS